PKVTRLSFFSHGQLYVAFSSIKQLPSIKFFCIEMSQLPKTILDHTPIIL
ncbi:hypothetical protein BD408DRAFT_408661, partial [Parasitella parasitica]